MFYCTVHFNFLFLLKHFPSTTVSGGTMHVEYATFWYPTYAGALIVKIILIISFSFFHYTTKKDEKEGKQLLLQFDEALVPIRTLAEKGLKIKIH